MKKVLFKSWIFILPIFSLNLSAQTPTSEITGVYQYMVDGIEGVSMISPTHFLWIITNKDRQAFSSLEPSVEEKAKAFEAINCAAGTWEFTGERRLKFTFSFHSDASQIGQSFEWEYDKPEGDLFSYWILQQDKSRGALQQARKLTTWNAPGACSNYNGTLSYVEWNGIYLQSGQYGGWIIQNEMVKDVSTTEGKAKAFDAINSTFAIGNCQNEKSLWAVLHSSDIRNEKTIIGTNTQKVEKGKYKFQILNPKGEADGPIWHVQRIQK